MTKYKNSPGRRKAFGQHFLKDQRLVLSIAEETVKLAVQHQCSRILEIGPGEGALTMPLLESLKNQAPQIPLILVEKDRYLHAKWPESWTGFCSDFLELTDEQWLGNARLAVMSNLPYSVGTHILIRLAARSSQIPIMVLMFQAEVAKRLCAPAGNTHRGSLSIWIQNRWDVVHFAKVPPQSFSPPPKVDSEVVILRAREAVRVEGTEGPEVQKFWDSFLRTCFAHRRKMLRSSLPWQNALEASGVDGRKRPEALDWQEWNQLFKAVHQEWVAENR